MLANSLARTCASVVSSGHNAARSFGFRGVRAHLPACDASLDTVLLSPASLALYVARRHGHKIKAPGVPYKIYHPSIQEPEQTLRIKGCMQGPARFIPRNFRHQQYINSIRTGEYLGEDWPYNCLGGTFWKARRYNATYHAIPPDSSPLPGVHFFYRLNVWACEWYENEKQRVRWFRAQFGFVRARQAAEDFRRRLVEAGRVDNRRTERQIRQLQLASRAEKNLRKRKFAMKDARRKGNSGTKLGPEWKVRKDYKKRGLLP